MKNLVLSLFALLSTTLVFASTGDPVVKSVNIEKSTIEWKGYKVTGSHTGTLNVQSGSLNFDENGNLSGGSFILDMASIKNTDMKGGGAAKLEGHLKSADFFGVENHPTAKLVITDVEKDGNGTHIITGDFTIKGITEAISFPASVSASDDGSLQATADIVVDRTLFGIKYGSGTFFDNLGDRSINDNFELRITLRASVGQ